MGDPVGLLINKVVTIHCSGKPELGAFSNLILD
jgi:hypothetical protein